MEIEFDDDKDAANLAKHGISLVRARDLEILAFEEVSRGKETAFRPGA